MKKILQKLAAVTIAAGTLISLGISAFAEEAKTETVSKGWVQDGSGWRYRYSDGSITDNGDERVIGGIAYDFSAGGYEIGKYTGIIEESGRRYKEGLPYTGLLKTSGEKYKFCLDGYELIGEYRIGNQLYSFDDKGIYEDEGVPDIKAEDIKILCTNDIRKMLDRPDGENYDLTKLKRVKLWHDGKWVRCIKKYRSKSDDLKEGYYRVDGTDGKPIIFKAVPNIRIDSKEIYLYNGSRHFSVSFTAEDISKNLKADNITAEVTSDDTGETIQPPTCGTPSADSEYKAEFTMNIPELTGCNYRITVRAGDEEIVKKFRIETLKITPWRDEYSLKERDLNIIFSVKNSHVDTAYVNRNVTDLYVEENGNWLPADDFPLEEDGTVTLKEGQLTEAVLPMKPSYYKASKLKTGRYRAYIEGAGYCEFTLTQDDPKHDSLPFEKISGDNVEKITMSSVPCGTDDEHTVTLTPGDGYFENAVMYLRQLELKGKAPKNNDKAGFGGFTVTVYLKDGTKITADYRDFGEVKINDGERFMVCGEDVYIALNDYLTELLGLDKYYYGYMHPYTPEQ